jgi:hypothetical protein
VGLITIVPPVETFPLDSNLQCPWEHTKAKLQNIITKVEKESRELTLDIECPHIVKALNFFCKYTFGRLHPLVHANKGLTLCNILHYYRE